MPPRKSTRTSARKIATSISRIAAQDLTGSDDETVDEDVTIVVDDEGAKNGDGEDEQEEGESSQEENDEDEDDEYDGEGEGGSDDRSGGSDDEEEDVVVQKKRKAKTQTVDGSEDEEDVVVFPTKRKHTSSAKKTEDSEDDDEVEVLPKKQKASKIKTGAESIGAPRNRIQDSDLLTRTNEAEEIALTKIVTLKSDDSWPALRTHILTKINVTLTPPRLLFSDYSVTFTVPRQVSEPMHLNEESDYDYLVKKAVLIVKSPTAKIIVEPKVKSPAGGKENEDNSDTEKKSSKKTKIPKARDILPGNVALNDKISELRERWTCPAAGGPCGSAHCFFTPDQPEHFPLGHDHFQSWAAGMLKGAVFADLETPPNNELFDNVAAGARAAKSLLKRRLEPQTQTAAKNTPVVPQININLPAELANLLRPPATPPTPITTPLLAQPAAFIPPPNSANMLIPAPRIPGPELSIADFCSVYKLDEVIKID
ncbi:hypothetical protein B0H13DRAFT_2352242 [Mycena leptocephala]|nr:hypothetical protein B0H13DRAFT_2352242 [Mycena leptocephala]